MTHDASRYQARLAALGYLAAAEVDGVFGPVSLAAFNRYRATRGMPPVAQTTIAELEAVLFPQPKGQKKMNNVLANVKSAWASKTNWTLAAGMIFNVLAFFGIAVPADVKDAVLVVGNGLVLIVAWVLRTWFTTSITAASAKKL